MTSWHIIRCERSRDDVAVAELIRKSCDVWRPEQLVFVRKPGIRRHTPVDGKYTEKMFPLLPGCLFSPILRLPDALHEGGRYPCSLVMVEPYTPAEIALSALRVFMDAIAHENEQTRARYTPRGPAVRNKQRWRDLKSGLAELAASAGVKLEEAA